MVHRTLLVLVLLPFLLLTIGGCSAKREALRPDGAGPSVWTRVPAADAIGVRLEKDGHPAPPTLLPLTDADKVGVRTLATPGVGWIMLIEVNFSISPPPREPADRDEYAKMP